MSEQSGLEPGGSCREVVTVKHVGLEAHDGYAEHSHEVRSDHRGVAREIPPGGEHYYVMGGERVSETGMQKWHNDRGLPWGRTYDGPNPIIVRRMIPAGTGKLSLGVHLANEHGINSDRTAHGAEVEHMHAHMIGKFQLGQGHYHGDVASESEREPGSVIRMGGQELRTACGHSFVTCHTEHCFREGKS